MYLKVDGGGRYLEEAVAKYQEICLWVKKRLESGELKPADGNAFTAADFRDYDFSGENVAVTYENISWQKK